MEQRCYAPAINSRFFPNTPSSWFWSSSPDLGFPSTAWIVDFTYGYVYYDPMYVSYQVRLVRGGQ